MDDDLTNLVPLKGRKKDGTFAKGNKARTDSPLFIREPKVRANIIKFLQLGAYRTQAARAAGVAKQTMAHWVEKGRDGVEPFAEFLDEMEEAEAFAEMRLLGYWSTAAVTNYQAARDLLRVRFRQRWNADEVTVAELEPAELTPVADDVDHLSEIMAAFEEAGRVPKEIAKGEG